MRTMIHPVNTTHRMTFINPYGETFYPGTDVGYGTSGSPAKPAQASHDDEGLEMRTATTSSNHDTTDAFAVRVTEILNGGSLALMTSVGYRTGLFDALAEHGPATVEVLADAAGLNETYTASWLTEMVAHGIVAHEACTGMYELPREHAEVLARTSTQHALSAFAEYREMQGWILDHVDGDLSAAAVAQRTATRRGNRKFRFPGVSRLMRRRAAERAPFPRQDVCTARASA